MCNYDKREEAKIFEDYADGMIAQSVMFQSNYLFCFVNLASREITKYLLQVSGGRKQGNGLVVPCIYHVNGNKKHIETFPEQINKLKKGKAIHMNIKIPEIRKGTFFVNALFLFNFCIYIYVNTYKEETSFA